MDTIMNKMNKNEYNTRDEIYKMGDAMYFIPRNLIKIWITKWSFENWIIQCNYLLLFLIIVEDVKKNLPAFL